MSVYTARIEWQSTDNDDFASDRYGRVHRWRFDGGVEVRASASPHIVPRPWSAADAVDPEEAFVAALSSCHMLWFLNFSAKAGFSVDAYTDEAEGVLDKNADGRMAMTRVTLRPVVRFGGTRTPSDTEFDAMHKNAHERCFIANSVSTEVRCEPSIAPA